MGCLEAILFHDPFCTCPEKNKVNMTLRRVLREMDILVVLSLIIPRLIPQMSSASDDICCLFYARTGNNSVEC